LSKEFLFPRTLDPKATLMIVIDTSGSVPTESLHKVFAEMQEVSKLTGGFWVVECDMIVQSKIGVSPGDPVPEIGKGRGGTSFAPPFKLAAEMSPAPDVLVYFTDGEGYAPKDPPPNLEVFWVIDNTEYTEPRFLGSRFGEIIYVTRDRQTKTSW
jgi:predicted metal-dependent peptidase